MEPELRNYLDLLVVGLCLLVALQLLDLYGDSPLAAVATLAGGVLCYLGASYYLGRIPLSPD